KPGPRGEAPAFGRRHGFLPQGGTVALTGESEQGRHSDGVGPVHGTGPGVGAAAVMLGMLVLVVAGVAAFFALRGKAGPPPPEIAGNRVLVAGREIYLARCVSCHGIAGKGDGPIARSLQGPAPRDLTAAKWKHGDQAEAALAVVTQGVKDTAMAGW